MADRPVVLGIDFGGTKIAAAIADADGTRIESTTIRIDPAGGAQTSFDRGIALARSLHERLAGDRELRAVGACTFGIPHETPSTSPPTSTAGNRSPSAVTCGPRSPARRSRSAPTSRRPRRPRPSGARWPTAIRVSISTWVPGSPRRSSSTAWCSRATTGPPARSATTCAIPPMSVRSSAGCSRSGSAARPCASAHCRY